MIRLVVLVILLLIPNVSLACRCAQQSLADYFAKADFVFFAELAASKEFSSHLDKVDFLQIDHAFKGDPTTLKALVTAKSSATCGVSVVDSSRYLVFAKFSDESKNYAMIDTCSGTRPFEAVGSKETDVSFVDTKRGEVVEKLLFLSSLELVGKIGGVALENSPRGLLPLPSLRTNPDAVKLVSWLRSAPNYKSAKLENNTDEEQVLTKEIGYEQLSAVVFEVAGDWYRLRTSKGRNGWIRYSGDGFSPYPDILLKRLTYLTGAWDGRIWPSPGAGIPYFVGQRKDAEETVVEVKELTTIADSWWIKVDIYQTNPCSSVGQPKIKTSGWVPAWNALGREVVWFWSRGC